MQPLRNDFAIYNDFKKGTRTFHLCLWPSSAVHYYCCRNSPRDLYKGCTRPDRVRSCAISLPGSLPNCPLQPTAAALAKSKIKPVAAVNQALAAPEETATPTPTPLQSMASVFMEQNCILEVPLLVLTQWCPSLWEPPCPRWMQICCRVSVLGREVSWEVRNRSALT